MNKKRLLSVIAILLVIFSLTGCGSGNDTKVSANKSGGTAQSSTSWDGIVNAAKEQKKITVYTFKYEDYLKEAAKTFKEKYGIEVEIVQGKNEATYQKVMAERSGKGTIDAFLMSGPTVKSANEQDLLIKDLQTNLPNSQYLDPFEGKIAEGYEYSGAVVPVWKNQSVFAYNSEYIKEPPKNFDELEKWITANPKKFTYCDPGKGGSGQGFVNSVILWKTGGADQYMGEVNKKLVEDKWPSAWAWMREISSGVLYAANNNDALDKMNRGEAWIAVTWEEMVIQWKDKGQLPKNIKMYIPENGMPGGADFIGIPQNAANKEAAMLFINHLMEVDTQKLLYAKISMHPTVTNVKIPSDMADKMISEEVLSKYKVPWVTPDYKAIFKQEWIKEVGSAQ